MKRGPVHITAPSIDEKASGGGGRNCLKFNNIYVINYGDGLDYKVL